MAKQRFVYRLAIVCDSDQVDPHTLSGEVAEIPGQVARLLAAEGSTAAIRVGLLPDGFIERNAEQLLVLLLDGGTPEQQN